MSRKNFLLSWAWKKFYNLRARLFYYSQNLNFCLDLNLSPSHLLRYLGVRLLKLGFMDIDADMMLTGEINITDNLERAEK